MHRRGEVRGFGLLTEPREATPWDLEFTARQTQAGAIIISRHTDAEVRRAGRDAAVSDEQFSRSTARRWGDNCA